MRLFDYDKDNKEIRIRYKGGHYKRKPLIPQLDAILRSYCHTFSGHSARKGDCDNPYLFPGRRKNRPISARQVNNIFNKWKTCAEIRKELTIHSFRAGFATILYRECKDFILVSRALDHHDLRTTGTYVDPAPLLPDVMGRAFMTGSL